MDILNIENDSQLAANSTSGILEITGDKNVVQMQEWTNGTIRVNGYDTRIYLGDESEQKSKKDIGGNDLLYQIIGVVEMLIILMIFYVMFNNIN